ncbi:hypothetical protein SAMN04488112_104176 [Melghirimyces thermohalophilus]|uniref:Uncharacterized protein n=1 Tax=Melghirimyces thermohalophilus TaxID=1236220 RepID=A0A1G6JTH1_9BACL|nr:hypothetical protein SAMN04488112_104176 [Melghirimyces thermohalophilus]
MKPRQPPISGKVPTPAGLPPEDEKSVADHRVHTTLFHWERVVLLQAQEGAYQW